MERSLEDYDTDKVAVRVASAPSVDVEIGAPDPARRPSEDKSLDSASDPLRQEEPGMPVEHKLSMRNMTIPDGGDTKAATNWIESDEAAFWMGM
ncbi:MAG TPA: hypothetical protein VMT34_10030 [Aggregatilineales bacterium]|nr:hypothetical protein [Aggregatilineales bacterium]